MSKGVIDLVLEDKGEGASLGTVTPQEFYENAFYWDGWVIAGGALALATSGLFTIAAAPVILPFALWGTTAATAVTAGAGVASFGASILAFKDSVEKMLEFKPEDYSYFINNYNLFEEDNRHLIATTLLVKIKKKLIEKENTTDDEKRFYKAFKDLVQFENKQSDFYSVTKTLITIMDWLFVLNGITNIQTGTTIIIDRYSKENMIADISQRVDALLKQGFKLDDTSDFRSDLGFRRLHVPYMAQRSINRTIFDKGQVLVYPKIFGKSKIASKDLQEAADNIAGMIEKQQTNSQSPGMKKYASLIGNDLVNNIIEVASEADELLTISGNSYSYIRLDYEFKYNGKNVEPDYDGWHQEKGATAAERRKATLAIENRFIKVPGGLNNTSVVSFGETFDPATLNQVATYQEKNDEGEVTFSTSTSFEGLKSIPQPGANVGDVVESLIDSAYAFFVAELGQSAFNNSNVNQKTLYDESVIYYSEIIARLIGTIINNVQKFYLYAQFSALFAQGKDVTDEIVKNAQLTAQEAANSSAANIATGGGLDSSLEITDEELKNRQKFVKQCILMYNLEILRTQYRKYIKEQPTINPSHKIHGTKPFEGRFHAIEDTESENTNTINKMIVPKGTEMKPLLEITPDIYAFLVPKIRLFRVVHKVKGDGLLETEFDFVKKENKQRINNLVNAKFDKGNSYGIKSFDFSFEGTSPATARNDIVANLSLHFQSFQDFIEEKVSPSGEKYRFVDLIIFPVNKKNRKGVGTLRAEEYDPSIYRIRAEVGWMVPENHPELDAVLVKRGFTYEQLKKSLILTNKSFYLNMVDHDFTIKDNGTVDISISYRAYIESALKSTKFDALSTPQLRKNREKFKEAMLVALQKENCSVEEIKTIKELFTKAEEETIKKVYRSILLRMNQTNSVFYVDANVTDIKQFRRDGFFSRGLAPRLETAASDITNQISTVQDMQEKASGETEDSNKSTLKLLQDGVKDYPDENMKEDNRINFFYLGDLIYTIMDNMYNEDGTQNIDMNKTKLLLSSFGTFGAFGGDSGTQDKSFNIIDIPVSVEYFYEWFTQNVVKPKKLYYPLMDFIRDLTNDLVVNLLFDSCANRPIDTKMRFNTSNFVLLGKGDGSNADPFLDFIPDNFPVIDLAKYYNSGDLPLLSDKEGEKNIQDFYNYIAIYPITTTVVHPGRGLRTPDENKGIYHFHIGSNKGLLKKINFSKTDMQYMRESRFMRNGFDGLMQLSAVYKASLSMIGNTIYYPGMDLFIDPVGIGGPNFNPRDKESIAYKTGLGGYHLVTRVKSTISPGKFETTVEAMWHNSGAGTGRFSNRPDLSPRNDQAEDDSDISDVSSPPRTDESGNIDVTTKCTPLVSSFEDYLAQTQASSTPVEFNPDLSQFDQSSDASGTEVEPINGETLIDEDGNIITQETLIDEDGNPIDEDGI
jgi:hypothetical protein